MRFLNPFNDLAVVQLREHVNASGLPAGFTNVKGGTEPALKSQLEFYDETLQEVLVIHIPCSP